MPSYIRVLVISSEEDGDFLSSFVASAQPSIPVTTVDLVAPGRSNSFSGCVSEGKDDGAEILEGVLPKLSGSLSFNPDFADSLGSFSTARKRIWLNRLQWTIPLT